MSTTMASATTLTPALAARGPLQALAPQLKQRLLERSPLDGSRVEADVREVIQQVRLNGDAALMALAARYDGAVLESIEVPRSACIRALDGLPRPLRSALDLAARNLTTFHRAQLTPALDLEVTPGLRLRRVMHPLQRVGVYAPGGRAAYPSSVLMSVIPARVAGVPEVLVCSPPGPDGVPSTAVLAACALAGADRVFAVGGAGAIAAMAWGTVTVPRVDRIVGPGNAWVAEAKRQVSGRVSIDCYAGPSEILILADSTADAGLIAAELVAQAEHDPAAAAVLVTTDATLLAAVAEALAAELAQHPRASILRNALASQGALLHAESVEESLRFANEYAPEHLLLLVREPGRLLAGVRNAGTVFIGPASSVAFGDYVTGANHVLPTAGTSRSFAGLGTSDFLRAVTVQEIDAACAARLAEPTAVLAMAEGLPGHARAARLRAMMHFTEETGPRASTGASTATRARPRTREAYRELRSYDPGRDPCAVDLSDNTNLFGVCPAAREVLAALPGDAITRYPSVNAARLKDALADRFSVAPECVTTGCGSDDLIDSAIRAFCDPGDRLEYPLPTFGVLPLFARMNGVIPVPVPLLPGLRLDVDHHLRSGARTLYLCSPNNPTGAAFDRGDVIRLIDTFEGLVLLDEAYADYADADFVKDVMRSTNAVILRTFSKAAGLAGLRVGFAIGPAPLVAEIEKSRGPYKVSQAAELAAIAVLERGGDWMRASIEQVRTLRARFSRALNGIGQVVLVSDANFVLLPLPPGIAATALARRLRELGVAVRPFPALAQLGECIRVTVGPWPVMEAFLTAFAAVMRENVERNPAC